MCPIRTVKIKKMVSIITIIISPARPEVERHTFPFNDSFLGGVQDDTDHILLLNRVQKAFFVFHRISPDVIIGVTTKYSMGGHYTCMPIWLRGVYCHLLPVAIFRALSPQFRPHRVLSGMDSGSILSFSGG